MTMIWNPKLGQPVQLHYAKKTRAACCDENKVTYHGRVGIVTRVGRGPGPVNAEILFPAGGRTVAPRGNLVALKEKENRDGN